MRLLVLLPLLACALGYAADTVDIDLPVALSAHGQPVQPDDLGFVVSADGRRVLLPSIADTHLWRDAPTGNAHGADLALRDNRWCEGLVRANLTDLPPGAPADAVFHCRVRSVEKPGQPGRFRLHRILVPWTEDASWKSPAPGAAAWDGLQPGRDFTAEPFASVELPQIDAGQVVEIPGVGAALENWRSGAWDNLGLLVLYDGGGTQISIAAREAATQRQEIALGEGSGVSGACDSALLGRLISSPDQLLKAVLRVEPLAQPAANTRLTLDGRPLDGLTPDCTAQVRTALAGGRLNLALSATGGTLTIAGPGDGKRAPRLVVTLRHKPAPSLFPQVTPIVDGTFATARVGHLWYGDRRLRLWGTLGYGSMERAARMGFNAYRLWSNPDGFYTADSARRGVFASMAKGDGSALDVFDRQVALLRSNGMFIMDTTMMLHPYTSEKLMPGVIADGSFIADGDDWPAWRDEVRAMKDFGGAQSALVLFDERIQRMCMRHAANMLNHVSPYTGRAYGVEEAVAIRELGNEQWVVSRLVGGDYDRLGPFFSERLRLQWVAWARERYRNDAGLLAAWGAHDGTLAASDLPLPKPGGDQRLLDDWARFVLGLSSAWQSRFIAHCRSQAPVGRGVAVTPFSNDTQYRPDLTWTFDNSRCEVQNFGMYFWDMGSQLAKPPSLYVMDSTTTEGRITAIYETNRSRPSPFRSEYPFILAAFASWQDWDAVFFHYWGGPLEGTPDERWLTETVTAGNRDHFWTAVHHSTDPVMCAAMAVAGRSFLQGAMAPAPAPAICRVGDQALLRRGAVSLADTAFAKGTRLRFMPGSDIGIEIDGAAQPVPGAAVASGDQILWDWPQGRLVVDTPTAKFLVGRSSTHRFRDGITVSGFTLPFTAFAVVSADGKPLANGCTKMWISATADARNTGFDMDLTRNLDGPVNQAEAMRDHGHAPLLVERPGWTLSFPFRVDGRFTPYDFALRALPSIKLGGQTLRWREREMWLGMLDVVSRGASAEPETDAVVTTATTVPANADEPATIPGLAAIPHPLPRVSWGDNAGMAVRTLRDEPFGANRTELIPGAKADAQRVLVRGADFRGGTADIELRFAEGRMREVVATYSRPPAWTKALADCQKEWGAPVVLKVGTQIDGSHATWKTANLAISLEEAQGVLVLRWEPLR